MKKFKKKYGKKRKFKSKMKNYFAARGGVRL